MTLATDLEDLESAEDFLDYFQVAYEQSIVHVNRLHILQRFHDYLAKNELPEDESLQYEHYKTLLTQAYQDFVNSDALTEKVFKVFKMHEPQVTIIPLTAIRR